MEHIPYNKIDAVLKEMSEISQNVIFGLAHYPAATFLPNGENAHCIIEPPKWYKDKLETYFPNVKILKWVQNDCRMAITFKISRKTKNYYCEIINEKITLFKYFKEVLWPQFKIWSKTKKAEKYINKHINNYYDYI